MTAILASVYSTTNAPAMDCDDEMRDFGLALCPSAASAGLCK